MNNPNSILFDKTLGSSFLGGFLNLPRYIFNHILGITWIGDTDIIGGYLHQNFRVGIDEKGNPYREGFFPRNWSLYLPPKRKVKLAPALCRSFAEEDDAYYYITDYLYSCEEDAKKEFPHTLVKWPAGPFIEIEEDGE
jgi:hypothetical protein